MRAADKKTLLKVLQKNWSFELKSYRRYKRYKTLRHKKKLLKIFSEALLKKSDLFVKENDKKLKQMIVK